MCVCVGGGLGAGKGGGNILYVRQTVDLQASSKNHEIIYASKRGEKWEKIQNYYAEKLLKFAVAKKKFPIFDTQNIQNKFLTLRISKTNYWLRGFFWEV